MTAACRLNVSVGYMCAILPRYSFMNASLGQFVGAQAVVMIHSVCLCLKWCFIQRNKKVKACPTNLCWVSL